MFLGESMDSKVERFGELQLERWNHRRRVEQVATVEQVERVETSKPAGRVTCESGLVQSSEG
jgi:hypothetical protein